MTQKCTCEKGYMIYSINWLCKAVKWMFVKLLIRQWLWSNLTYSQTLSLNWITLLVSVYWIWLAIWGLCPHCTWAIVCYWLSVIEKECCPVASRWSAHWDFWTRKPEKISSWAETAENWNHDWEKQSEFDYFRGKQEPNKWTWSKCTGMPIFCGTVEIHIFAPKYRLLRFV